MSDGKTTTKLARARINTAPKILREYRMVTSIVLRRLTIYETHRPYYTAELSANATCFVIPVAFNMLILQSSFSSFPPLREQEATECGSDV